LLAKEKLVCLHAERKIKQITLLSPHGKNSSRMGGISLNNFQEKRVKSISAILMVAIVILCIFAGGFLGYLLSYFTTTKRLYDLENQLSKLQKQMENLQQTQNTVNITHILIGNVSLSKLYERVRDSVEKREQNTWRSL